MGVAAVLGALGFTCLMVAVGVGGRKDDGAVFPKVLQNMLDKSGELEGHCIVTKV